VITYEELFKDMGSDDKNSEKLWIPHWSV